MIRRGLGIVAIFAGAVAASVAAFTATAWTATELSTHEPARPVRFASVSDTPLLSPTQQRQAIETDRVAFDCAGDHYVIVSGAADMLGLADG